MNTDQNAIAASLDTAKIAELAQLNDEAFWDYARRLTGVVPPASFSSFPSSNLPTLEPEHSAPTPTTVAITELVSSAYLECIVGEHCCLLPLAALAEIIPAPQQMTFLPNMPFWMLGLTAWRGEPVAVIDLQSYLTDTPIDTRAHGADGNVATASGGMLLMLHHTIAIFGLFVSGTGAVLTIPAEKLVPISPAVDAITWLAPSRVELLAGISESRVALDVPSMRDALMRQIGVVTAHG